MNEIKLQGSERKRRQLWAGVQAKLFYTSLKSLNLGQWQDTGAFFFNQSKDFIILFIAAQAVIEGRMSLGMMMATQYIVGQLNAPLQQFIAFIRSAQDAKISLARLGEIHQQPDENANIASTLAELYLFTPKRINPLIWVRVNPTLLCTSKILVLNTTISAMRS
jgi:ATP-binding cassette, subfamily B, bacterial